MKTGGTAGASSPSRRAAATATLALKAMIAWRDGPCVETAPLGNPVVPEV